MATPVNRVDADDIDGQFQIAFTESMIGRSMRSPGMVLRVVNGLDVDVDVTVGLTTTLDEDNERLVEPKGPETVAAGEFADDLLTEPYDKVVATVDPGSAPTSGRLEVIVS